jgi:hypothetical protein
MPKLILVLAAVFLVVPARALAGETSIFYYPWYGTPQLDGSYEHWDQGGHVPPFDLATSFYPARGPYSSSDPKVVGTQMREIAKAGIREVVSSWWGWGSIEDDRLPMIARMARSRGLQVAVQIEPYPGRTAATVEADIGHLRQLGISRFYVYHPFEVAEADWAPVLAGLSGAEVLAQTANVSRAAAAGFAGIYTYDIVEYGPGTFASMCARAHQAGLLCAPSVGPGYDALRATGDTKERPRRQGATYDAMWQAAIDAHADRVTITSYNEWHEGTQIEPALTTIPRRLAAHSKTHASPVAQAYLTYDGAYGAHGKAAASAYLARTAFWTALYRAQRHVLGFTNISRSGAAKGRETRAYIEAGAMAGHSVSIRRTGSACQAVFGATGRFSAGRDLLLGPEPSRLTPAVRATDAYLAATSFGSISRPTALVEPSVVLKDGESSRLLMHYRHEAAHLGECKLLVDRG